MYIFYNHVSLLSLLCMMAPSTVSGASLRGGAEFKVPFNNKLLKLAVKDWLKNPKSTALRHGGHISEWDTSRVWNMSGLFANAVEFDEDLSRWDVSNVRDFRYTFANASSFTSDLSNWNTAKAKHMKHMFHGATSFNSDLHWNTSNVLSFGYMFAGASSFNGSVGDFNINSAYDLSYMFCNATNFNRDISGWTHEDETEPGFRVKWAQNFKGMFQGAASFTGYNISSWNTFAVHNMNSMFKDTSSFSADLSSWKVQTVKDFGEMFAGSPFPQNLCWNIKDDANTTGMFDDTSSSRLNTDCKENEQRIQPNVRSAQGETSSAKSVGAGHAAYLLLFTVASVMVGMA